MIFASSWGCERRTICIAFVIFIGKFFALAYMSPIARISDSDTPEHPISILEGYGVAGQTLNILENNGVFTIREVFDLIRKKLLFTLNGVTRNKGTCVIEAMQQLQRANWKERMIESSNDPLPNEIKRRAAKIRETWSAETHRSRSGRKGKAYVFPVQKEVFTDDGQSLSIDDD